MENMRRGEVTAGQENNVGGEARKSLKLVKPLAECAGCSKKGKQRTRMMNKEWLKRQSDTRCVQRRNQVHAENQQVWAGFSCRKRLGNQSKRVL